MDHQLNEKKKSTILSIVSAVVVFIAIILVLLLILQGSTTYTKNSSIDTVQSLTCESNKIIYPFFENDKANTRSLKINAILNDDKISTISLLYKLYYDDSETIEHITTSLHAAINKSFGIDGLDADVLGATYSTLSDSAQMTLYAQARNINGITAKYFLLENTNGNYQKETLLKIYNDKGFRCTLNEQINNSEENNEKDY